jgi:hypothetical protein
LILIILITGKVFSINVVATNTINVNINIFYNIDI